MQGRNQSSCAAFHSPVVTRVLSAKRRKQEDADGHERQQNLRKKSKSFIRFPHGRLVVKRNLNYKAHEPNSSINSSNPVAIKRRATNTKFRRFHNSTREHQEYYVKVQHQHHTRVAASTPFTNSHGDTQNGAKQQLQYTSESLQSSTSSSVNDAFLPSFASTPATTAADIQRPRRTHSSKKIQKKSRSSSGMSRKIYEYYRPQRPAPPHRKQLKLTGFFQPKNKGKTDET